jgi:hypothetical protein
VLGVTRATFELVDLLLIHGETDSREALAHEGEGQGQPDVPHADDADQGRLVADLRVQLLGDRRAHRGSGRRQR